MDYLFKIPVLSENHNLYISHDDGKIKIFSDRSIHREIKSVIKKVKSGYTLIYIAPYHKLLLEELKTYLINRSIIWLIAGKKEGIIPIESLIDNKSKWKDFILSIKKTDRFQIHIHPILGNLFKNIQMDIQKEIKNAAIRLKTIEHFSNIWQYNYRKNQIHWEKNSLYPTPVFQKPDYFLLAGPSADFFIRKNKLQLNNSIFWAADTVLPILQHYNLLPELTFSIDSGYGSMEHFIHLSKEFINRLKIILDPLSFPRIYELHFKKKWIYESSNPLIQNSHFSSLSLYNETGDVYGIMQALFKKLFSKEQLPIISGHDQKTIHFETHLNGTSYHKRYLFAQNRFNSLENQFFHFSLRWLNKGTN